jgi:molybdopterin-guanine dinucleotide biosynthesis protein A
MTTAVILAGGKSSRMEKGRDKLLMTLRGETLLDAAVSRFSAVFGRVFVSVSDIAKYPQVKAEKIEDIYKDCGPMGGLHAALRLLGGEGVFLTAADMPFSSPEAAIKIIGLCGENDAALMRDNRGRYEPLFAYYKKTLLPEIEKMLTERNYKMSALLNRARIKIITADELGPLWKDNMLENINRIEDYNSLLTGQ